MVDDKRFFISYPSFVFAPTTNLRRYGAIFQRSSHRIEERKKLKRKRQRKVASVRKVRRDWEKGESHIQSWTRRKECLLSAVAPCASTLANWHSIWVTAPPVPIFFFRVETFCHISIYRVSFYFVSFRSSILFELTKKFVTERREKNLHYNEF